MSEGLEILGPDMMALPKILNDLRFENAAEVVAIFCLLFNGGESAERIGTFPEFTQGLRLLKARGVLAVKGFNIKLNFTPMQAEESEAGE